MTITYRQLIDAYRRANELAYEAACASGSPLRWHGSAEQRDDADARLRAADVALDQEVEEFKC